MSKKYQLIREAIAKQSLSGDVAEILEKLQYLFAKELGINVSFHALVNFFLGKRMPAEDDKDLVKGLVANGYKLHGSWEENQKFWKGMITKAEYDELTAEHNIMIKQGATEEEESVDIDLSTSDAYNDGRLAFDNEFLDARKEKRPMKRPHNPYVPGSKQYIIWNRAYNEMTEFFKNNFHETEEEEVWKNKEQVTKSDYKTWLRVIRETAKDRKLNPNVKANFEDIAFDMLDNDPKIDMLSGDTEKTKRTVIGILWRMYNVDKAVKKASDARLGLGLRPVGTEEEEGNAASSISSVATPGPAANDQENSQKDGPSHVLLRVEEEGYAAAKSDYDTDEKGSTKNPYATGSLRAQSWNEGYNRGEYELWGGEQDIEPSDNMTDAEADADVLKSAGMGTDEDYGYFGGNEEEERTPQNWEMPRDMKMVMTEVKEDGRRACEQAYIKALDSNKPVKHVKNPHPANTRAHSAWARGYVDCQRDIEGV